MATSRLVAALLCAAPLALATLASCGQITGLSDEFEYDGGSSGPITAPSSDAAPGVDAAGPNDAATGSADARTDGAVGGQCTAPQIATATTDLTAAGSQDVPLACQTCLAQQCCTFVDACAKNTTCDDSMKCTFGCQKDNGQNRQNCLAQCHKTFTDALGACITAHCSTTCALQ